MMHGCSSKNKQGLNWGCDNSPPLNKNLDLRFKRRERRWGTQPNTIFMIQVALHKNIDSITIIVSMSSSENCNYQDKKRKGKL